MKAFLKKEWMEALRTGRAGILLLTFILFGIMNPAIAKLTPWLMETMTESLEGSGFILTAVTVDAMTSWTQFYKNIPMALIIFVLLCSGIFTAEYQKGTLIPVVTKGLARRKIAAAKIVMLAGGWSVLYAVCYGITFGYNAYFWDNGIAAHLTFGAACWWLFGIWVLALAALFSAAAKSNIQVLLGTGGVVTGVYLLGMLPETGKALPTRLMEGVQLLQGVAGPEDYTVSIAAAGISAAVCVCLAMLCFERKKL